MAGVIALTALLGFVFGAELHSHMTRAPLIGTAAADRRRVSSRLSIGMLLERPHAGMMRVVTSDGPGGRQLRRLLLPTIAVPALLGLVGRVSAARRRQRRARDRRRGAVVRDVGRRPGWLLTMTASRSTGPTRPLESSRAWALLAGGGCAGRRVRRRPQGPLHTTSTAPPAA
jgi:hypothetical protein